MKIVRIDRNDLIDLGVKEVYPKILIILKEELPSIYEEHHNTETSGRVTQLVQEYQAVTNPTTQTLSKLAKSLRRFETRKELQQVFHLIGLTTHPHSGMFDQDTTVPRLQRRIDHMIQEGWVLISVVPIYIPHRIETGGSNELIAIDYYIKK